MTPTVLCRVCVAPHERGPLYSCLGCGSTLCPERTDLLLTGRHWVSLHGRMRVCGSVVRAEVRSDLTVETVAAGNERSHR